MMVIVKLMMVIMMVLMMVLMMTITKLIMMIEMIIMALIIALMMVGDNNGDEGYVQILTEYAKHGIKTLNNVRLDRL